MAPASVISGAIGWRIAPNPTLPLPKSAVSLAMPTMPMPTSNAIAAATMAMIATARTATGEEQSDAESGGDHGEEDDRRARVVVQREVGSQKHTRPVLTRTALGNPGQEDSDDADQRTNHGQDRAELDVGAGWLRRLRHAVGGWCLAVCGRWWNLTMRVGGA